MFYTLFYVFSLVFSNNSNFLSLICDTVLFISPGKLPEICRNPGKMDAQIYVFLKNSVHITKKLIGNQQNITMLKNRPGRTGIQHWLPLFCLLLIFFLSSCKTCNCPAYTHQPVPPSGAVALVEPGR